MTNHPSLRNLLFASTFALTLLAWAAPLRVAGAAKPLRVLLLTGGCCHDYAKQKDILKKGLEERINVVVDQVHTNDSSTRPALAIFGNPDYAKGYDLVIHDECAADVSDPAKVEGVLKPHRDGIPAVNLHCAMHCYRIGDPNAPVTPGTPHGYWFDYLGLQSSGHGPQQPIAIHFTGKKSGITQGLDDWTTINEELYNNIQLFPTATPLARGRQTIKNKDGATKEDEYVVAWMNDY